MPRVEVVLNNNISNSRAWRLPQCHRTCKSLFTNPLSSRWPWTQPSGKQWDNSGKSLSDNLGSMKPYSLSKFRISNARIALLGLGYSSVVGCFPSTCKALVHTPRKFTATTKMLLSIKSVRNYLIWGQSRSGSPCLWGVCMIGKFIMALNIELLRVNIS